MRWDFLGAVPRVALRHVRRSLGLGLEFCPLARVLPCQRVLRGLGGLAGHLFPLLGLGSHRARVGGLRSGTRGLLLEPAQ